MNVKVAVNSVSRIIDPKLPIEKIYKQLKGVAKECGIVFGEPSAGVGLLQWTLEDSDWIAFNDLSDSEKPQAAAIFEERKRSLMAKLNGSSLACEVLVIPEEKYLFFRNLYSQPEVALAAWGYQYPHLKTGNELETWRNKIEKQRVVIAFLWDGCRLPHCTFRLNHQKHCTGYDGNFEVDQPLPVGSTYDVETALGDVHTLTVVKGQSDYEYDLTEYFSVNVTVERDGLPLGNKEVTLSFNGKSLTLTTDSGGSTSVKIPFEADSDGKIKEVQSECRAVCDEQSASQIPSAEQSVLNYRFEFFTPKEEVVPPPPPPPVVDPPKEEDKPEPPVVPGQPEFVGITLVDYGGYPIKEMAVTLQFPDKRVATFTTDENGRVEFPKEWMPRKGRVKIKFIATPEYQQQHDLHADQPKRIKKR